MPQLTDDQYLNKAVEEISEKYHVPAEQVREAIQSHQEIRQELNPRETVAFAVYKADKAYQQQAEGVQEHQSRGYKIG